MCNRHAWLGVADLTRDAAIEVKVRGLMLVWMGAEAGLAWSRQPAQPVTAHVLSCKLPMLLQIREYAP